MPAKTVTLDPCPSCRHASHTYTFEAADPPANQPTELIRLFTCPATGVLLQAKVAISQQTNATANEVGTASLENQAVSGAAKALYASSPPLTIDFAKTMITASTGAVTLYFAVVKFLAGDKVPASQCSGFLLLLPALAYLVAAVCFTVAYAPRHKTMSLDVPRQITEGIINVVHQREDWNRVGMWLLVFGTGLLVLALGIVLDVPGTLQAPATPTPVLK